MSRFRSPQPERRQAQRPWIGPLARGFTLIELLVVISIIALLVAILLPSLAKARESAYQAGCLSNLRQTGIALNSYTNSYRGAIPPNAHNPDPATAATTLSIQLPAPGPRIYARHPSYGSGLRVDYALGGANDFTWTGLGLMMATDFVPYTREGSRVFYCPAERKGGYDKATSYWGVGFGFYWSSFQNRRWVGAGASGTTVCSYSYGALRDGHPANAWTIPNGSRGPLTWDISRMSKYVAVIDYCSNMPGTVTDSPLSPHDSHGKERVYTGFNRMWFDGHAKWFSDVGCVWDDTLPGTNTSYSNAYSSWVDLWHLYD